MNPGGRGCSELRWRHCTPAWATELESTSKKTDKRKKGKRKRKGKERGETGKAEREKEKVKRGKKRDHIKAAEFFFKTFILPSDLFKVP